MTYFQFKPDPKGGKKSVPKPPQSAAVIEKKAKATAIKKKIAGKPCRACPNEKGWAIQAHHIVHRSQLGGKDMWHVNNLMPLCLECHTKHHSNGDRTVREAIRKSLTHAELEYTVDQVDLDYADRNYFRLPKSKDAILPTCWADISEEAA